MHLQLRSRAGRHARLIGGIVGAAVLLTGGGALATTSQNQPQAATSGVTMDQAQAFVGVTPTRVLDTRQIGSTKFNPGETRTLSFAAHVPPEATSVSLAIVSPTGATSLGYFTMWPSGQPRPNTSVLNPAPPYDLATSVLLRLGAGQSVDVYNAFGQADLVVDILGYFVPLSSVEGLGSGDGGGSQFLVGSGAPASTLGNDGDVYYDTVNKIFYGPKDNGDWGDGSSAAGPAGPQGPAGAAGAAGADGADGIDGVDGATGPAGADGADGIDGADGATGPAGADGADGIDGAPGPAGADGADGIDGADGAPGAPGAAGSQFLSGAVAPTTEGVDGDFYLNTATGELYGPKTGGAWGSPTDLTGPTGAAGAAGAAGVDGTDGVDGADGSQILSGDGAPDDVADGVDGDFYFDTTNLVFYGPKTGGAWGTGTSTAGPQGPQGPAGTMGPGTQVYGSGIGVIAILGSATIDFPSSRVYGGGVGPYNAATGELTLSAAGTYRVSYTSESTLGVLATIAVEVNGTAVPGSDSGGLLSTSSFNGETFVTAAAGDVLELTYSAALGLNVALDASMIVEKVA